MLPRKMIISLKSEGLTIRTLLSCICIILIFQSCSEEESELDKSQLTLGIWYYEYKYQLSSSPRIKQMGCHQKWRLCHN